ncbi:MAG: acyl-[acyl-carrier-protein] thioesterase [Mycobacteriaceae bacterium]
MGLDSLLSALPEQGYIYKTSWRIKTTDMDSDYRLSLNAIAGYLQEAGAEHLEDAGAIEDHPDWIVRRTVIDIVEPVPWPNNVTIKRWCSGISPRWCNMRVQIVGEAGGLIETEGFWINMNKSTMGPARMQDRFFDRLSTTTEEKRLKWKAWLTDPLPEMQGVVFPLRRTDLDHFNHVNNTAYFHIISEFLSGIPELSDVGRRYVIEYVKPITLGEEVAVHVEHSLVDLNIVTLWLAVAREVRAIVRTSPKP